MTKFLATAVLIIVWFTAAWAGSAPLPQDIAIVPPSAEVPVDATHFSGKWSGGKWDGILDNVLVVEKIEPDGKAVVVYAWGDNSALNITHGWTRQDARIENGILHIALKRVDDPSKVRANVTYRFMLDGTLSGEYSIVGSSQVSKVMLQKE